MVAAVMTELWVFRILALWLAVDFGLLSAAYGGAGSRILLKQKNGVRKKWAWPVFAPYFLFNEVTFLLFRLLDRRPPYARIVHNLYLGRRMTSREARRLRVLRWRAILDLAAEFEEVAWLRREKFYRSLPVLDAMAPDGGALSATVDWLAKRVAEGPVFVHCALGHGRSATLVVAYLLASGEAPTIEDAIALVRAQRPGIGLSARQREALDEYTRSRVCEQDEPA
jgi:hypothetical protein